MNIQQLETKLKEIGINKEFYSLNGGLPNETFCINKTNKNWEVYYSERRSKSELKLFNSESDACNYFFTFITSDNVVINNLNS